MHRGWAIETVGLVELLLLLRGLVRPPHLLLRGVVERHGPQGSDAPLRFLVPRKASGRGFQSQLAVGSLTFDKLAHACLSMQLAKPQQVKTLKLSP